MMAERGDWNWGLVVPEGWITIDVGVPPADRRGALVAAVQELGETSPLLAEASPTRSHRTPSRTTPCSWPSVSRRSGST